MPINHFLDPMHIEGNVGKSLVHHIYGERKKIGGRVAWRWSGISSYGHGLMKRDMSTSLFLVGCCQSHKGRSFVGGLER
jgi:hypothetical protein